MIRDLFDPPILGITLLVILFLIVLFGIDIALATTHQCSGTISYKSFTPSQSSVTVGSTSDGKVVTGISSSSEKYILFVKDAPDSFIEVRCNKQFFLNQKEGDKIVFYKTIGKFSGIVYSSLTP